MFEFAPVSKDRLYFDKYEYSICLGLNEAGVLREKTASAIARAIEWRNKQRYNWSPRDLITEETKNNLFAMFNELEPIRDQIKLMISFGILYIYSNDIAILRHLAKLPYVTFCNASQAVVDRPRDVVFKTDPKFQYRSYFREIHLEEADRDRLLNFIDVRKDTFSITSTVKSHLRKNRFIWLQRWHFIDHKDPKDITMLSLVYPGLIRKTVPIQAK